MKTRLQCARSLVAVALPLVTLAGCTVTPAVVQHRDSSVAADSSVGCNTSQANCSGAAAPNWELQDLQPKSSKYLTSYGLDVFRGDITLVALFSAT
jgi:hypothetical protein